MDDLSDRCKSLSVSKTLAMAQKSRELAAKGFDIISLSLGEPDFIRDLTLQSQLEEAYDAISQFAMLLAYGDIANGASAEEE